MPKVQFAHYTSWELDDSAFPISCGTVWQESNYWKHKLVQKYDLPKGKRIESLCAAMPQVAEIVTSMYEIINKGKYAQEVLKELVFEDVRLEQFPALPSRKTCIFLLALEDHDSAIRKFGFTTERPHAVEIEVENADDVFLTDAMLLNCGTLMVHEMKEQAVRYWNGERSGDPLLEYLYVGEFMIVGRL